MARAPKPVSEPVIDAPVPTITAPSTTVSNTVKGTTLHLGDGRKLAFGEEAEVSAEMAAELNALLAERAQ